MTGTVARPIPLPGGREPVWVAQPEAGTDTVVVVVHALGENRTGTNYLLRDLADGCVRAGMAAVRFDLPGCGESQEPLAVDLWDRRMDEVRAAVEDWRPGTTVHCVTRGLSAALLPARPGGGLRAALSPPAPEAILSWLAGQPGILQPRLPLPPDDIAGWTALGAEPNLVGGLRVPVDLVRALAERLSTTRYDLAVIPRTAEPDGPALRMSTADPLFRFQSDRAALSVLVPQMLREWRRWCPEPS